MWAFIAIPLEQSAAEMSTIGLVNCKFTVQNWYESIILCIKKKLNKNNSQSETTFT